MVTLRERFHERFGDEPRDGKFDSDEELAPHIQFRLEAIPAKVIAICSNCHELPAANKGRTLCAPCDKYRRRTKGEMRPPRLFNSHRRTPWASGRLALSC